MRAARLAIPIVAAAVAACGGGSGANAPSVPPAVAVQYAAAVGASSWASLQHGIAAFADGSTVVVSSFVGEAVLGAGEPGETRLVAEDGQDSFVARYRPDGSLAWARRMGGTATDTAREVAALPDGSCLVTGYFWGDILFGEGEAGETRVTAVGNADLFIARFSPGGDVAWARTAGGLDHDYARAIAAFPDGSSVVVGAYGARPMTFGAGEARETTLPDGGFGMDLFVARYGPDGTLAWVRGVAGAAFDGQDSVTSYADGSCVVAGGFWGNPVFGAGEPGETTLLASHSNASDVFVARYDASGALAWARRASGASASNAAGSSVAALGDGGCLVAGTFRERALFGEGEPNETELVAPATYPFFAFVSRFDRHGALVWARGVGTANLGTGPQVAAYPDGSFALAGTFSGIAELGELGEIRLTAGAAADAYVAGFDAVGRALWAEGAGGPSDDVFNAMALPADGSIVVAGAFFEYADVGAVHILSGAVDPEVSESLIARYR